MSSAGHILDMIQTIKKNRALRKVRGKSWKNGDYKPEIEYQKTEYNFGKPTEEELEIIKENIRSRGRIYRMRTLTFTLVLVILIFFGVYLFMDFNNFKIF